METLYFWVGLVIAVVVWIAFVVWYSASETFSINHMLTTVLFAILMVFVSILFGSMWPFVVLVCIIYIGVQYITRRF